MAYRVDTEAQCCFLCQDSPLIRKHSAAPLINLGKECGNGLWAHFFKQIRNSWEDQTPHVSMSHQPSIATCSSHKVLVIPHHHWPSPIVAVQKHHKPHQLYCGYCIVLFPMNSWSLEIMNPGSFPDWIRRCAKLSPILCTLDRSWWRWPPRFGLSHSCGAQS